MLSVPVRGPPKTGRKVTEIVLAGGDSSLRLVTFTGDRGLGSDSGSGPATLRES